ncbi:WD40/YVTN/BNR-like repeat-containing protein [Burkholderia stabilis]|nr:YCF48-related protein [Burkholderia stabilis]
MNMLSLLLSPFRINCRSAVRMAAVLAVMAGAVPASADSGPVLRPAVPAERAEVASASMLGVYRAGSRIVAVGDHGVILLSDDDGKTFRQAVDVPTRATLTSVYFTDARNGWAVGHWGVILRTSDGGEHWTMQRSDVTVDRPLFSVCFINDREGWAVGLWSLMLHTDDGGATWSKLTLPVPAGATKADANLYAMVRGEGETLLIAGERGLILRSEDGGKTWRYEETGVRGSLWAALALDNNTLLVGGLRGGLARSPDGGRTWMPIQNPLKASITGMTRNADGSIVAVGLDGAELVSADGGRTFHGTQRPDRAALTAVLARERGAPAEFSMNGPLMGK